MSDLDRRLRAEARLVHVAAPDGLAQRIRTAVAGRPPVAHRPAAAAGWLPLAAAAGFLAAAALAWSLRGTDAPAPPAVVVVPAPPGIGELLRAAGEARPATPGHDEISALGEDLAAAARTVREAIPF